MASEVRNHSFKGAAWPRGARDFVVAFVPLIVCAACAILVSTSLQAAFVVVVLILGVAALGAPTAFWVVAALVSSFTFQALTTLGLLPSMGTVLPIPVAWGAFFVALLRKQMIPSNARQYFRWLLVLFAVTIASGLFNHAEILRPFLSIGLLGMPFAVLLAVLVDPPGPRERSILMRVMMGLIVLQIPVAYWQFALHGGGNLHTGGDRIQGTFISRGGGAHTLGAVALIGAIWLLSHRVTIWRVALAAVLAVLPFLADAKQILIALPIAVLATAPQGFNLRYLIRSGFAVGSLAILLFVLPVGKVVFRDFHQDSYRQGGTPKAQVGHWLWNHLRSDPVSLTFGKGPAETVTLAAYYTTPGFLSASSPFHALGLKPAGLAIEADYLAYGYVNNSERSSYESAVSSALGVFGDLGFAGLLAYGALLVTLLFGLARCRSPEGTAAMSAVALFAVLGLAYGWWEIPGLAVFVGALAGVALTGP